MSAILTLARRELIGLFASPIAWVVLALFALGTGLVFAVGFGPGRPATMATTFDATVWLLVFLAPAVSMRLLSEELARGTLERLVTSPVSDTQIVLGKWLASWCSLVCCSRPCSCRSACSTPTANPTPAR